MATSVIITTPIPTLEEFGKQLGLSKARQSSLLRVLAVVDSSPNLKGHRTNATTVVTARRRAASPKGAIGKPKLESLDCAENER